MLKINTKKEKKPKEENKEKSSIPRYITFLILSIILGGIFTALTSYAATIAATNISYSNSTSGLSATNAQDAIDNIYNTKIKLKEGDYVIMRKDQFTKTSFKVFADYKCKPPVSGTYILDDISINGEPILISDPSSPWTCEYNTDWTISNYAVGGNCNYSLLGYLNQGLPSLKDLNNVNGFEFIYPLTTGDRLIGTNYNVCRDSGTTLSTDAVYNMINSTFVGMKVLKGEFYKAKYFSDTGSNNNFDDIRICKNNSAGIGVPKNNEVGYLGCDVLLYSYTSERYIPTKNSFRTLVAMNLGQILVKKSGEGSFSNPYTINGTGFTVKKMG